MQAISRVFVPALLAATLALSGCQTRPPATDASSAQSEAPAAAERTVQAVEIYVAQTQAAPGLIAVQMPDGMLYLQGPPVLSRADLTDAAALSDHQGRNFVGLRFTPAGAQKLDAASRQNIGNMLALVIGRELMVAPRITEPLDRGIMAFGMPSATAAADLAARIRGDAAR